MTRSSDSPIPPDPSTALGTTRSSEAIRSAAAASPPGSLDPTRYPFLAPAAEPGEIGRLGSFRVLHLLGAGGMGMVFQAEDLVLRRAVALKVLKPELSQDDETGQRFLREARTMAAVKSDQLVTIFQAGQDGATFYLAMELLQGEALESWMRRLPRPGVVEIARVAQEIASGLAAIHAAGLVHRDVKPGNIWLEAPNGRVKILDFGLARRVQEDANLTLPNVVMGTPAYMSPEQARGAALDARSDLFSFGCILYALCAGVKPFQGVDTMAILTALAVDQPRPVHEINPAIPLRLSNLLVRLLAKQPEQRPASAREVIEVLNGLDVQAAPPRYQAALGPAQDETLPTLASLPARLVPRQPTSRRTLGLLAVLAGVLLAGLVWLLLPSHEEVYLADLPEESSANWPLIPPAKGKGFDKEPPPPRFERREPVSVAGKRAPHGIFMHPPPPHRGAASITYRLNGRYRTFQAEVTMNDSSPGSPSPVTFAVYGDNPNRPLWESRPILTQSDSETCQVDISGVKLLRLEVRVDGEERGAHAVWVEPRVSR